MEAVRVRKPKTKKPKERVFDNEEETHFIESSTVENGDVEETVAVESSFQEEEVFPTAIHDSAQIGHSHVEKTSEAETPHHETSNPTHQVSVGTVGVGVGRGEAGEPAASPKEAEEPLSASEIPLTNSISHAIPDVKTVTFKTKEHVESVAGRETSVSSVVAESQERAVSQNPLAQNWTGEGVRISASLYPSLLEKQKTVIEPKPLSRTELGMYFVNAEARALEGIVDQFVETNLVRSFEGHPLYIYLSEYLKAVTLYEGALEGLKKAQRQTEECRDDVWKVTDNRVSGEGRCADGKCVVAEHFYRQCHLDQVALRGMQARLEDVRHSLYHTSFGCKCTAELARFQVECYLFEVFRQNPLTKEVRDSTTTVPQGPQGPQGPQVPQGPQTECLKLPQTAEMRTSIGILFAFHRMPLGSDRFRSDIRTWLCGCVGVLLRVCNFFDQLFLLNHLVRCPSSVLQWASFFIQLTLPSAFSPKNYSSPYVKHFFTMLCCVLSPAKARDDFLCAFDLKNDFEGDTSWIVLDPDAEGTDEMRASTTMDVEENDVFCLLKQFPFDGLFSCLFGSGSLHLEPFTYVTEYDALGLFQFCHELMELLVQGLDNPSLNKYGRLNKKNAQTIRELVIHCKEFWERLLEVKDANDPMLKRLQLNFEEVVVRGMFLLLKHNKSGTVQFLVGWPSHALSVQNVWRTVVVLYTLSEDDVPYRSDLFFWKRQLTELQTTSKLEEKLHLLDEGNATYLLTALGEVVKRCDERRPLADLVEGVTMDLLRMTFLTPLRTTYAKLGRHLISAICVEHPILISEILSFITKNFTQIGSMSVFLFQEIPLKLWKINRNNLEIVCQTLINSTSIQDPSSLLAREILSNLNWAFCENGELFLHEKLHQQTALAVVQAFLKFISTKNRRLLLYESLLQLSSIITSGKCTPEQSFVGWCWEVLLDLKLHRLAQHANALATLTTNTLEDDTLPTLPTLTTLTRDGMSLSPLSRQPISSYVAVMLTDVGHSSTGMLNEGLDWTGVLVENYLYIPALKILEMTTPLFFLNNQTGRLLQQDQFHFILNGILQADATYLRMVKNIIVTEFPGKTLKSFGNMVIHQLLRAGPNLPAAIRFWCRVLTSLKNWNRSQETLFVLDQVAKFAFYAREVGVVMDVLREAYEEYRQSQPARGGGMTALVSWMTSGSSPAYVLIDSSKLAPAPWLGYVVLQVQAESSSGLWLLLIDILTGEKKRSLEDGLKKASHKLDVPLPAVTDLPLFLLTELLISLDVKVEIFPLLCQELFRLFLKRSETDASIGDQFFLSPNTTRLLKPLKQKLKEAAEYYRKRGISLEERSPTFYENLHRAASAFALWMDEAKLHHEAMYLPSLPSEYEAELLSSVLDSHSPPWLHFVDTHAVYVSMQTQAEHWLPFEIRLSRRIFVPLSSPIRSPDTPLPPPSTLPSTPPFIPVDQNSLFDPSKVLFALRPDLTTIEEAAKQYVNRVTEHGALDGYFVELIAALNVNTEKEITVFPTCHKDRCAGPAEIVLKFKEFSRNDVVHRTYLQNREEWNNLIIRAQKIDLKPLVTSVVRFEKAISALIEATNTGGPPQAPQAPQPPQPKSGRLAEVGAVLFYHMLVFIGQDTDEHPLTRNFFHSCLEVLGQKFIANQKAQCRSLLDTCLNNQRVIPMLMQHFTPNTVPAEFLQMYKKSQQTLQGKNNEALMQLLSTFDIHRYLLEASVDVSGRLELLSTIAHGIVLLGNTPPFPDYPLFEIYAQHMRCLVEFRFPLHAVDVLRCLFDLTRKGVLPPNGWSSCFFSALGIPLRTDRNDTVDLEKDFFIIKEAVADGRVSFELSLVVSEEVWRFFSEIRKDNKTAKSFGLFAVLGPYTRSATVMLMTLAAISLRDEPSAEGTFMHCVRLFQPWLNEEHAFLQADLPLASTLISALRLILSDLTLKHPDILCHVWLWYHHCFGTKTVESFSSKAVSEELVKLPWEKFTPNAACAQNFAEVVEGGTSETRNFLGKILLRIPWDLTLSFNKGSDEAPFLMDVIKVFLFFASDEHFRPFAEGAQRFVEQTKSFDWSCLEFSAVQAVVQTVGRDPESLGISCGEFEKTPPLFAFMKVITEFEANNLNPTQSTVEKRALFLHVYGRAAVAHYTANNSGNLVAFILATLKTVEMVWQTADPHIRYRGYLALAVEMFSLSNYVSDKKIDNSIRSAILIWIAENPGSLLLVPMVTASCRSVVNMEAMVTYLETITASHFRAAGHHDWSPFVHALETPELNRVDFVKTCLMKQSFLTLHVHCLRMIQTVDVSRRGDLLHELVEWCRVRPTPENQNKVFLLWNHVLLLGDSEDSERTKNCMRDFVEAIFGFTEEKGGFLSAVGVGKPTVLSRSFKVIARSLTAVGSPLTTARKTTGKSATLSADARNAYESMKSRKEYALHGNVWPLVDGYIASQGALKWRDVREMFVKLLTILFKEINFLTVVLES